jgi:hypothetical protein
VFSHGYVTRVHWWPMSERLMLENAGVAMAEAFPLAVEKTAGVPWDSTRQGGSGVEQQTSFPGRG